MSAPSSYGRPRLPFQRRRASRSINEGDPVMKLHPYLFFGGRCEEAIAFYQRTLGAEVLVLMRFSDAPEPPPPEMIPPGFAHKVMHSSLRIGENEIMASDGCIAEAVTFTGVTLALNLATAAEAERLLNALADGGQVQMPLAKTFFSAGFGSVKDRFGVSWMVVADAAVANAAAA
jgi:PhnB protein